jgi:hypothetical protein
MLETCRICGFEDRIGANRGARSAITQIHLRLNYNIHIQLKYSPNLSCDILSKGIIRQ